MNAMGKIFGIHKSAADRELNKLGNETTGSCLLDAIKVLSDTDLARFEAEVDLYSKTGFVGVLMSRVLVTIPRRQCSRAA